MEEVYTAIKFTS